MAAGRLTRALGPAVEQSAVAACSRTTLPDLVEQGGVHELEGRTRDWAIAIGGLLLTGYFIFALYARLLSSNIRSETKRRVSSSSSNSVVSTVRWRALVRVARNDRWMMRIVSFFNFFVRS